MSKELIEITSLLRMRFVTNDTCHKAADRIEELERDLLNLVCRIHRDGGHYIAKYGEAKAIADADIVAAQNNADLDALRADSARLWGALNTQINDCINFNGGQLTICIMEASVAALAATPEQSLAEYRNKVIEECAKRAEAYTYMSQNFNALAEELRAMKEQP